LLEDAPIANVLMRWAGGQPARAERSGNPQRLTLCLALWINSLRRCENPSCAPPIGRSWQAGFFQSRLLFCSTLRLLGEIQTPWLRAASTALKPAQLPGREHLFGFGESEPFFAHAGRETSEVRVSLKRSPCFFDREFQPIRQGTQVHFPKAERKYPSRVAHG
jgi:hypothetical protein